MQNQKSLLIQYAMEQGWDIYGIYGDEDYSGADRERPAFKRLLQDASMGKFDVVLVKTQSRFTRDMEMVERYIHGKFPQWGIRFVALVDHMDTGVKGNKKARQISGLINEWYLEDLSENIRAVLDHKRRSGQYIGGFALYGYQKAPGEKNRLVIDPPAAEVVRRIFGLYLTGLSKQRIADVLNGEEIPNPTRYKQEQGLAYHNGGQTSARGLWSRTTIGRILRERMYTGDMVQGRRAKVSYKLKKCKTMPPESWIVVADTHEAIISKETFAAAARLLGERTRSQRQGDAHPLAGKVRCMRCGAAMVKVSYVYKGNRRAYLRCCAGHTVRLDALEDAVRQSLKARVGPIVPPREGDGGQAKMLRREIQSVSASLGWHEKALRDLYLDKTKGLVGQAQFQSLNEGLLREKDRLARKLDALSARADTGGALPQGPKAYEKDAVTLTRRMAVHFIDKVEIGAKDPAAGRQTIRIHWLF